MGVAGPQLRVGLWRLAGALAVALGAGGAMCARPAVARTAAPNPAAEVAILYPPDGLVLTPAMCAGPWQGLRTPVVVAAPVGAQVHVNGDPAPVLLAGDRPPTGRLDTLGLVFRWEPAAIRLEHPALAAQVDPATRALYLALLPVREGALDLEATATLGATLAAVTATAYGRSDAQRTYAITVDDVADALAELTRCGRRCTSLFDNPTFAFLKRMHEEYGAVFSLYLFEQGAIFPAFHLAQMPDRFRSEWGANSDWLRLGFHGRSLSTPVPYRNASYGKALADLIAVRDQVIRFAGDESWDVFSRTHWWSGSRAACRAWRDSGIRGLYAAAPGYPGYYLSPEQNALTQRCDSWRDHDEDLVFIQTDLWVERDFVSPDPAARTSPERVPALLDSLSRAPAGGHEIAILAHEFFPEGHPEVWHVADRLQECIAWLSAHGYEPRLAGDDPFLASLPPVPPRNLRAEGAGEVRLTWSDSPASPHVRYRVYRRDGDAAAAAWHEVGETAQLAMWDAPPRGVHAYRVVARDPPRGPSGSSQIATLTTEVATAVTATGPAGPRWLWLGPNAPNPFNAVTRIAYELPGDGPVRLEILSVAGQRVRRLDLPWAAAGRHDCLWDGRDDQGRPVGSGLFLYRLHSGAQVQTRRLLVLR